MSTLRPFGNTILVRLDTPPDMIDGIVRPGSAVENEPVWATVLAVGPGEMRGRRRVPVDVVKGDRVLVAPQHKDTKQARYIAQKYYDGDSRVVLIKPLDVICIDEGSKDISSLSSD